MPARDDYPGAPGRALGAEAPANSAAAVVASDSAELTAISRAIYFGVGGNVNVVMRDGTTALFTGVVAGCILPLRVKQVKATNTTAASMVALW